MAMEEKTTTPRDDELAESLNELFSSLSTMIKTELQGSSKEIEVLQQMNSLIEKEYRGFGDVAAALRVYVEQLKKKSFEFDVYVQEIERIEQQVTELEAVVSFLDKRVLMLESKLNASHYLRSRLRTDK